MRRRTVSLAAAALAAVTALSGCAGEDAASIVGEADIETSDGLVIEGETIADAATLKAAKGQTLTLYTGYQEANQHAFNEVFTADTGIEVEYVRDVANKLSERVRSEAGAGQLNADVVITSDYKVTKALVDAGVMTPNVPDTLPEDADDLVVDDGDFTAFANVAVTFAYNTNLVSEEDAPTSWADLLDERWKGKIGITSGMAGGSSIALNRFVTEKVGDDFWPRMADLDATIYDSGGQRQEALARGELEVATAGPASVNTTVNEDGAPIEYVVPEEGIVLFSFFIGQTATAPDAEAAEVFINYALSKRGQSVLAAVGDYSVRADVDAPVADGRELPPLDSDQVWVMEPTNELEFGDADAEVWREAFGR